VLEASGLFKMWGNILKGGLYKHYPGEELLSERYDQIAQPVAVSVGDDDFLALGRDGTVWGSNDDRVLGKAPGPYKLKSPMRVESIPPIVALDAGAAHLIALDGDGNIWEWGHNWLQPKMFAK